MGICVYAISKALEGFLMLQLVVCVLCGIILYLVISAIAHNSEFIVLKNIVWRIICGKKTKKFPD